MNGCRTGDKQDRLIQDRWDAGLAGYSTAGMQDKQQRCRKGIFRRGGRHEKRDSGDEGCWKRRMQDRRKQERRDAGQADAGHARLQD